MSSKKCALCRHHVSMHRYDPEGVAPGPGPCSAPGCICTKMRTTMVGEKVWVFDQNHRVCAPGSSGSPIYREHCREFVVTGENQASWLIGSHLYKIAKSDPGKTRCGSRVIWSKQELDDDVLISDCLHKVAHAMYSSRRRITAD